jgi:polyhydroxyalkanoate synthesis regulator phasin
MKFANQMNNVINNATLFAKDTIHNFMEDTENIEQTINVIRTFAIVLLFGLLMYRVCECCEDPFGEKVRKRLRECEEKLEESENTILGLEEELDETKKQVEILKTKFQKYKDRYVSCKQAAQRFIDTHAEPDEDS